MWSEQEGGEKTLHTSKQSLDVLHASCGALTISQHCLNLTGLLVIRQIDNTSPGGAPGGKLVPGSHRDANLDTSHQTFQQRRSENQGGHSSP